MIETKDILDVVHRTQLILGAYGFLFRLRHLDQHDEDAAERDPVPAAILLGAYWDNRATAFAADTLTGASEEDRAGSHACARLDSARVEKAFSAYNIRSGR
ncbi:hypothetical protein [Paraburkholderia dipogonis]|uniref:hypothetical protein n=1 Tax=Paraburkholderia dipogonis TaxID=1211383 RepID=UPI0038BCC1F0